MGMLISYLRSHSWQQIEDQGQRTEYESRMRRCIMSHEWEADRVGTEVWYHTYVWVLTRESACERAHTHKREGEWELIRASSLARVGAHKRESNWCENILLLNKSNKIFTQQELLNKSNDKRENNSCEKVLFLNSCEKMLFLTSERAIHVRKSCYSCWATLLLSKKIFSHELLSLSWVTRFHVRKCLCEEMFMWGNLHVRKSCYSCWAIHV